MFFENSQSLTDKQIESTDYVFFLTAVMHVKYNNDFYVTNIELDKTNIYQFFKYGILILKNK